MPSSAQEGYSTTIAVSDQAPPAGGLPDTGADLGPAFVVGGFLLVVGIALTAALNGWRSAAPKPAEAPAFLRGGVVPSTWNEE